MQDVRCEECDYFDYDEETDTYECMMNLDMDDYERFLASAQRLTGRLETVHFQFRTYCVNKFPELLL